MIVPSEDELRRIYAETETIAVVGCSGTWPKPSHVVPAYLQAHGFRVLPVNPGEDELLGEPCVATLADVDEPIDVVNVFRPAPEVPAIARDAVELGARCLWIQNGIESEEGAAIAAEGGLDVVMGVCIAIVHGDLGLGPGVTAWKAAREAAWQQ